MTELNWIHSCLPVHQLCLWPIWTIPLDLPVRLPYILYLDRWSSWKWKIYYTIKWGYYSSEKLILKKDRSLIGPILVQSSVFARLGSAWLWCSVHLIFLQQKCTTIATMAAVTLTPHLSFRFTSPVVVPNLPWVHQSASCVVAAAVYVECCFCLGQETAYAWSYGSASCL